MAGLVPAIHWADTAGLLESYVDFEPWMAGTSPAMTVLLIGRVMQQTFAALTGTLP
jgi:hypothetical protein